MVNSLILCTTVTVAFHMESLHKIALYVYIIHTRKCIGVIQSQLTSVKSLEHVITNHYIFLRFQIQHRTIITLFETESIPNVLTK